MRITQVQLNKYYRAERNWISANDSYNLVEYGMTAEKLNKIGRAVAWVCGNRLQTVSLREVNKVIDYA